jgi:hypothetical protein
MVSLYKEETMFCNSRWMIMVLIFAGLYLTACREKPERQSRVEPSVIEQLGDSILYRVRLTPKAIENYGIKTATVREAPAAHSGGEGLQTVVPRSAVIYDPDGDTWIFTNPESMLFIREHITVERIDGDLALLSEGPPPGTGVVIAGAENLLRPPEGY